MYICTYVCNSAITRIPSPQCCNSTHTGGFLFVFLQNLVEALSQNNAASFELARDSSNLVDLLNELFGVS